MSKEHSNLRERAKPSPREIVDELGDGPWRDRRTGDVGSGRTYGEHSFNNRPVDAEPVGRPRRSNGKKVPFDPFNAPKPRES